MNLRALHHAEYCLIPYERFTPGMAAMVGSLAATILTITMIQAPSMNSSNAKFHANSEYRGSIKQNGVMFGTPH